MPPRARKRKSESESVPETNDATKMTATQMIATKTGGPAESPLKKRRTGITVAQKQALIDNLQLEVTERARKLRAQYNLQAQGLRTRIEIRVNRIPRGLRKARMGDLLQKYAVDQRQPPPPPKHTAALDRVPPPLPVPEKDARPARPVGRPPKKPSDLMGDKENQEAYLDNPKKRLQQQYQHQQPLGQSAAQVLSPASSNSRLQPRDRTATATADVAPPPPVSPAKSFIARPVSPVKQAAATMLLSSLVEKARATRAAAETAAAGRTTKKATARKATGGSTAPNPVGRPRRTGGGGLPATAKTAATAAARRVSGASEASDGSTATVVRKGGRGTAAVAAAGTGARRAATAAASSTKKAVMSSIKKGVASASTKRAAAASKTSAAATTTATAAATTTRSGRVLRKRD